jgi:hypothetical protein
MLIFEVENDIDIIGVVKNYDLSPLVLEDDIINGSKYHKGFIAVARIGGELVVFQLTVDTVLYYIDNFADFGIVFTKEIVDSMFDMQVFFKGDSNLTKLKDKMLDYFGSERVEEYETCSYIVNKYNSIKNDKR